MVDGVGRDPGLGGGTAKRRSGLGHGWRGYVAIEADMTVRAGQTTYRGLWSDLG